MPPPGRSYVATRGSPNADALAESEVPTNSQVLVVDDDADVLASVAQVVQSIGSALTVQTACSAYEALAALSRQRFDLIISDLHMADMDGVALLEAARQRQPGVACVLMSGDHHEAQQRLRASRAAYIAFLAKPFPVETLVEHVTVSLRRAGAA